MKIDFMSLQVGTRVWSVVQGWGGIREFVDCKVDTPYRMNVDFDNDTSASYTPDGREWTNQRQVLFLNEFKIPKEAYQMHLEVDTKVLVKDAYNKEWLKRYFSHFDTEGNIYCFCNGASSWSKFKNATTFWSEWKLYMEES